MQRKAYNLELSKYGIVEIWKLGAAGKAYRGVSPRQKADFGV